MEIPGGYYIKARIIQGSSIQKKAPYIREIWDWLLRHANHEDVKYNGYIVKRGQLFRSYDEIKQGLAWYSGFRKETYSGDQVKRGMAWLRKALMVTTTRAPGGVLITILNYSTYQDPKNYGRTNGSTNDSAEVVLMPHQGCPTYNKNVRTKEVKETQKQPEKSGTLSGVSSDNFRKFFNLIKVSCGVIELKEAGRGLRKLKPYQWVQIQINKSVHPGAIDESLRALVNQWDTVTTSYFGFLKKLIEEKSPMYWEKEESETCENFKKDLLNLASQTDIFNKLGINIKDLNKL